jgi:hypothetical protein
MTSDTPLLCGGVLSLAGFIGKLDDELLFFVTGILLKAEVRHRPFLARQLESKDVFHAFKMVIK